MSMHVNWTLLTKYFQNRCSGEEMMQIENWRNSDPEHHRFFEEMAEIWQKSGNLYDHYVVNKTAGWEELSQKLSIDHVPQQTGKKVTLKLVRWAAMVILLISTGVIINYLVYKDPSKADMTVILSGNEKTNVVLPDSSVVTLNKNASLKYEKDFHGNLRNVFLKGTAFFSVTPDKQRPFVVKMPHCSVKVVGTSFYLNSDSIAGQVTLIVVSGKVLFYQKSEQDATLVVKDEKATLFESSGTILKNQKIDPNEMAWKTGNFIFEEEKLEEVCKKLSAYYGTKISIDSSLNNLSLTAGYNNQKLEEIVEAIKSTFDIQADTHGKTIVFRK